MPFTDCDWVSLGLVRTVHCADHVESLLCGVPLGGLIRVITVRSAERACFDSY